MTAEEFLKENVKIIDWNRVEEDLHDTIWTNNVLVYMREFAKFHVAEALKAASESKSLCTVYAYDGTDYKERKLCKESVLNAYPLENIT